MYRKQGTWVLLLGCVNKQSLGSCMLGKLFCVLAIFILIVATQLRRYPLKRQNSPSSLFSCSLFFFYKTIYWDIQWPCIDQKDKECFHTQGLASPVCWAFVRACTSLFSFTTPSLIVHTLQQQQYHFVEFYLFTSKQLQKKIPIFFNEKCK